MPRVTSGVNSPSSGPTAIRPGSFTGLRSSGWALLPLGPPSLNCSKGGAECFKPVLNDYYPLLSSLPHSLETANSGRAVPTVHAQSIRSRSRSRRVGNVFRSLAEDAWIDADIGNIGSDMTLPRRGKNSKAGVDDRIQTHLKWILLSIPGSSLARKCALSAQQDTTELMVRFNSNR